MWCIITVPSSAAALLLYLRGGMGMKSVRPVPQPTSRIPSPNSSVSPAQLSPFGPHPQRQIANHSIQQTSTQSGSTTQLYPVRHLSLTPLARRQHADTLELQTLLHSVYSECVFPASSLLHYHPSLTTAFTLLRTQTEKKQRGRDRKEAHISKAS